MANAHLICAFWDERDHRDSSIRCNLRRDVRISPQALQDYCATLLSAVEHDLVVVCGTVAFTDRKVRRQRGTGWARDLTCRIPVMSPEVWRQPDVYDSLVEALEYVTGDRWAFEFVAGGAMVATGQLAAPFDDGPYVVLPFSDGMDSYLQWQLLKHEEPGVTPLRVQTASRAILQSRVRDINRAGSNQRDRQLRVPVRFSVGNHAEPTYRSRTFLFFCMAMLAAAKTSTARVLVGENGIGALGPALIPYGDECPHRTTHPAFTRRVARFVNALLGTAIVIEHPQVERTKGEVLRRARDLGITGWETTNSCARDGRANLGGRACGVCSNCLLRRVALHAAGCGQERYFWEDLRMSSLSAGAADLLDDDGYENSEDIMRHAVHGMEELVALANCDSNDRRFRTAAVELSEAGSGMAQWTPRKVQSLLQRYATEWKDLRSFYGGALLLDLQRAS